MAGAALASGVEDLPDTLCCRDEPSGKISGFLAPMPLTFHAPRRMYDRLDAPPAPNVTVQVAASVAIAVTSLARTLRDALVPRNCARGWPLFSVGEGSVGRRWGTKERGRGSGVDARG